MNIWALHRLGGVHVYARSGGYRRTRDPRDSFINAHLVGEAQAMSSALAHRVQMAFDRCNEFPEAGVQNGLFHVRADAYLALIELRNMCPEIILALQSADQKSGPEMRSIFADELEK